MNLDELTRRAGAVFRGRVVDVRAGSVAGGGGILPVTIYRIAVAERMKGDGPGEESGVPIVEIRMIGAPAGESTGTARRAGRTLLADVPRLRLGEEYLLFTTTPGPLGLSTTVGLGQGCFRVVRRAGGQVLVVNSFDNRGLFWEMPTTLRSGAPAPYAEIVRRVRDSLVRTEAAP